MFNAKKKKEVLKKDAHGVEWIPLYILLLSSLMGA